MPPPDPALVGCTAPLFRIGFKAAALALRRRFPAGAAGVYQGAEQRGEALAPKLGLRLVQSMGPSSAYLPFAAVLAELLEPFLDDFWRAPPKEQSGDATRPGPRAISTVDPASTSTPASA